MNPADRLPAPLLALTLAALAASAVGPFDRGTWLLEVAPVALAVPAAYELLQRLAAVLLGQGADAFLGTQGDPWDTQWDMFLALCGALVAQLVLGRAHDRALARLAARPPPGERRAA